MNEDEDEMIDGGHENSTQPIRGASSLHTQVPVLLFIFLVVHPEPILRAVPRTSIHVHIMCKWSCCTTY